MAAIPLDYPATVPATAEKTYGELWLSSLGIQAQNPNAPIIIRARLEKARTLQNGKKELMPGGGVDVCVPDFFAAATEAELQLMSNLLLAIKARAGV